MGKDKAKVLMMGQVCMMKGTDENWEKGKDVMYEKEETDDCKKERM